MTYVPCKSCEHCGGHTSAPYDPAASSTSEDVACGDVACLSSPAARCLAGRCYYSLVYAEASSSEGWLVKDGAPSRRRRLVLRGCVSRAGGSIKQALIGRPCV